MILTEESQYANCQIGAPAVVAMGATKGSQNVGDGMQLIRTLPDIKDLETSEQFSFSVNDEER